MKKKVLLFLATVLSANDALTLYQSNMALITHTQEEKYTQSTKQLVLNDVVDTLYIDSINVRVPTDMNLHSWQYQKRTLSLSSLLQQHLNKTVMFYQKGDSFLTQGKLLAVSPNVIHVTSQERNRVDALRKSIFDKGLSLSQEYLQKLQEKPVADVVIHTKPIILNGIASENIVFEGNASKSDALLINVESFSQGRDTLEVDYLTSNIGFASHYDITLEGENADLSAKFLLHNNTSYDFESVRVQCVSGDIANKKQPRMMYANARVSQKSLPQQHDFGQHVYVINSDVNLSAMSTTSVNYLSEKSLEYEKNYVVEVSAPKNLHKVQSHYASQVLHFKGVSKALARGSVRVFTNDDNHRLFIGEDYLSDKPAYEAFDIRLGKTSEISVVETLRNRRVTSNEIEKKIAYEVKNSSHNDKTITLHVPLLRGEGTINTLRSFDFSDASLLKIPVEVHAHSSVHFVVDYSLTRKKKK